MNKIIIVLLFLLITLIASVTIYSSYPDDGGWYIMQSKNIAQGKLPYKDFFFPQGPFMAYLFSVSSSSKYPILISRIQATIMSLIGILCFVFSIKKICKSDIPVILFLVGCILYPLGLSYIFIVKTHSPVIMFLGLALLSYLSGKKTISGIFLAILSMIRVSIFPILLLFIISQFKKNKIAMLIVITFILTICISTYIISDGKIVNQLFIPMKLISFNDVSKYFNSMKGKLNTTEILNRKVALILRSLFIFPFVFILFFFHKKNSFNSFLVTSIILFIIHLTPDRPYDEYQIPAFFMLLFYSVTKFDEFPVISRKKIIIISVFCFIIPYSRIGLWAKRRNLKPYFPILEKQLKFIDNIKSNKKWYFLDSYIALKTTHKLSKQSCLGKFSFIKDAPDSFTESIGIYNENTFEKDLSNNSFSGIYINDLSMNKSSIYKILKKHKKWEKIKLPKNIFSKKSQLWILKD